MPVCCVRYPFPPRWVRQCRFIGLQTIFVTGTGTVSWSEKILRRFSVCIQSVHNTLIQRWFNCRLHSALHRAVTALLHCAFGVCRNSRANRLKQCFVRCNPLMDIAGFFIIVVGISDITRFPHVVLQQLCRFLANSSNINEVIQNTPKQESSAKL